MANNNVELQVIVNIGKFVQQAYSSVSMQHNIRIAQQSFYDVAAPIYALQGSLLKVFHCRV